MFDLANIRGGKVNRTVYKHCRVFIQHCLLYIKWVRCTVYIRDKGLINHIYTVLHV